MPFENPMFSYTAVVLAYTFTACAEHKTIKQWPNNHASNQIGCRATILKGRWVFSTSYQVGCPQRKPPSNAALDCAAAAAIRSLKTEHAYFSLSWRDAMLMAASSLPSPGFSSACCRLRTSCSRACSHDERTHICICLSTIQKSLWYSATAWN